MKKIHLSLLFFYLIGFTQAFASFSLSGSKIVQTGTDNNLSGLSSISGVTVTNYGFYTSYDIGNYILEVKGTLNIAVNAYEQLIINGDNNANVKLDVNGGTLNIGKSVNESLGESYDYNRKVTAVITHGSISNSPTGFGGRGEIGRRPGLSAINSGKINITGAYVSIYTGIGIPTDGILNVKDSHIYSRNIYVYSAASSFVGSRLVNLPTQASFSTLNDVFVESQLYFGVSGSTPQLTLDITDIPDGPTIYIGSWGSNSAYPVYNIKNAYHGSAYVSTIKNTPNPGGVDGNPSQRYLVNFLRDVKFHTADISQNSISGVKVYLSGGTVASSQQAWNGTAITGVTALANTTLLTTNSSGDTPVTSINLGSNINSSTAAAINYERTSNDDEFSVSFWSYNHLFGQIPSQSLKGNGQLTVTRTLVDDSHISESTKATVDAYTHIEDLDQLYDRGKSWKIDNISSEYPAIDEQLFDASGTTLDLGALNLTLDGTTATPFSVNQTTTRTTIAVSNTLRFGSKFDKITTTGVVTTTNGGSIETGYTDSTGSYTFIELTNLDQQDVLIQSQLSGSAVATLTNVTGLTGTYKILVPAPVAANTSLSITATRDGYAPWTDTVPRNTLTFQRGVSTSLSNSTGINQRFMINLAIKILQKTEALSHVIYHTPDPVPSMNVSITLNNDQTVPTITNQEAMLQILYRILNKTSALREAIQD